MKYLAFPFFVLPVPAIAHDAAVAHDHGADYLVPAIAGLLAAVALGMAVRRLSRIRA